MDAQVVTPLRHLKPADCEAIMSTSGGSPRRAGAAKSKASRVTPKKSVSPSKRALEALARLEAIETQARVAAAKARAEAAKSESPLTRVKNLYDVIFHHRVADRAWREELDRIDARLLEGRYQRAVTERGGGPLSDEVARADRRLLEQRYQAAKRARGGES
jgi:hypothetical protein